MKRTEAFLFLCRCLTEQLDPGLRDRLAEEIRSGQIAWERVVEIASECLMTTALHYALAEKELLCLIPADLREYLHSIHDLNRIRNLGILDQAFEIGEILNGIGVEPLVFKGAGQLCQGLYPDPAMRIMHDIDILVPEDRSIECRDSLMASGYQVAETEEYCPEPACHWPNIRRAGRIAAVELHYRSPWPELLDTEQMYAGSEPITHDKIRLRSPSPTTAVIVAIAHGYLRHESKRRCQVPLRDLYETALLIGTSAREIDWRLVNRTLGDAGHADALRAHSMMLKRFLGQAIPGVSELPRRAWFYWHMSLLGIDNPVLVETITRNIADFRGMFANTTAARQFRTEMITLSAYPRKLRNLRNALRRRSANPEDPFRN